MILIAIQIKMGVLIANSIWIRLNYGHLTHKAANTTAVDPSSLKAMLFTGHCLLHYSMTEVN